VQPDNTVVSARSASNWPRSPGGPPARACRWWSGGISMGLTVCGAVSTVSAVTRPMVPRSPPVAALGLHGSPRRPDLKLARALSGHFTCQEARTLSRAIDSYAELVLRIGWSRLLTHCPGGRRGAISTNLRAAQGRRRTSPKDPLPRVLASHVSF